VLNGINLVVIGADPTGDASWFLIAQTNSNNGYLLTQSKSQPSSLLLKTIETIFTNEGYSLATATDFFDNSECQSWVDFSDKERFKFEI
jgi:hypothetical protein